MVVIILDGGDNMEIYNLIVALVGDLPTEFKFIYAILTLVLSMLILAFLFSLFYIPLELVRSRR